MIKHILDLTLYGYFNTYMADITLFYCHQDNGFIEFIMLQNMETTTRSSFYTIYCRCIVLTGGGHLELWTKKLKLFQFSRFNWR